MVVPLEVVPLLVETVPHIALDNHVFLGAHWVRGNKGVLAPESLIHPDQQLVEFRHICILVALLSFIVDYFIH